MWTRSADRRTTRREALRMAGAAAVGGAALAACGPVQQAASVTPASAARILLTLLPSQSWPGTIGKTLWALLHDAMQPFLAQNPGVDVQLFSNQGYQSATETAMLAGAGPDVFSDWVMPPFVKVGQMLDMEPLVKRDNMDLSGFPQGEMGFFKEAGLFSDTNPGGLYAVPAYLHTEAYAVNLSVLDGLGITYPEPGWTIAAWIGLWESVTNRSPDPKKKRVGTDEARSGYDYGGGMITPYILWGYGGEYVDPSDPTRCYLDSPGSIACGEQMYRLHWEGVSGQGNFAQGSLVSTHDTCTCGHQVTEAQSWQGFKWDYFQDPVWPVRKSAYAASDFYGIWSGTKYPEQAWDLMKWLAFGPDWQRMVMRTALAGPNQAGLWEEWVTLLRQVAPPLAHKNLEAFAAPVVAQEPYFGHVFRYNDDQAKTIIGKYGGLLDSQKMGVRDAFTQAAQQINALQKAGAEMDTRARGMSQVFPTEGPSIVGVTPGL